MLNIPLLMGAPATGASGGGSQGTVQIVMLVAVFAVFWLLIIRPQRKKQKDTKKMLDAIKKGDQVSSIGGIRGIVKVVNDDTVIIEVDHKGSTLEFSKNAIGSVTKVASADPAKKSKDAGSGDKSSEDE